MTIFTALGFTVLAIAAPEQPVTPAQEEESVRSLLARLVPEEVEGPQQETVKKKVPKDQAPLSQAQPPKAIGFTVPLLAGVGVLSLMVTIAFFVKRRDSDSHLLRRLASEQIGPRQQIVLVEALGEYLLIATGGREALLLAQLDQDQAEQRLAEVASRKTAPPKHGSRLASLFNRKAPRPFDTAMTKAARGSHPRHVTPSKMKDTASEMIEKKAPAAPTRTTQEVRQRYATPPAEPARPRRRFGTQRAEEIRKELSKL